MWNWNLYGAGVGASRVYMVTMFGLWVFFMVAMFSQPAHAHRRYHHTQPTQAELDKRCLTKSICTNNSTAEIIYKKKNRGRTLWTEKNK